MRKSLIFLVIAVLLAGGWFLASPWLAMKGLRDAALAGDSEELAERIDFDALRASVKQQTGQAIAEREGRGGIIDAIGGVVANRVADSAIERLLTPDAMVNVIAGGTLGASLLPKRLRAQPISWNVERTGLDAFRSEGTYEDGSAGPVLLFERDGIGWEMVGFEFPESQ